MDYPHYTTEDFASDESFQKWVLDGEKQATVFWNAFLKKYPGKQKEVDDARQLLLNIGFEHFEPDRNSIYRIREAIHQSISEQNHLTRSTKYNIGKGFWYGIAASIALLVTLFSLFYFKDTPETYNYATEYGEIKNYELPDGSRVTLNANSVLTYSQNQEDGLIREVTLSGEAYFEIKPLQNKGQDVPFLVISNDIQVEVLGTSFNVNSRKDRTSVVLQKGKVRIAQLSNNVAQTIDMQPGEMVKVTGKKGKMIKETVNTEKYTSWRKQIFEFENTPLQSIANTIEDYYGWQVEIKDENLKQLKFSAKVHMDKMTNLLILLKETFGIKIEKNEATQTIILKD